MENVLYFFIMFSENLFKYVQLHETTIKEKRRKGKHKIPLMNEGVGGEVSEAPSCFKECTDQSAMKNCCKLAKIWYNIIS